MIYLDYASLTPIDPRVLKVMGEYSKPQYANPSSWYKQGVAAKKALDAGRKGVADFLHAHADEIIFTSGGTEANNLALRGVKGRHLIISEIEHSSIRETAFVLEKNGVEVTRIGVDEKGIVRLDELKKAIKPETFLVSIMMVNNETGAVQPIREIAKIIRQARARFSEKIDGQVVVGAAYPLFHTDAAQAALYEDLNVDQLGVDLLTLDGSKVYGPRGMGALYVRRKILNTEPPAIEPIIYGGGQEKGLRSGTENLPSIMGFAKALEIIAAKAGKDREKESERIFQLKDYFVTELLKIRRDIRINSGFSGKSGGGTQTPVSLAKSDEKVRHFSNMTKRDTPATSLVSSVAPHILNISIPGIDNEFLLFQLDAAGIACSTKSSCLRDEDESYVLKAMGADSKNSLRFSFGRWTKKGDITIVIKKIRDILSK